MTTPNPQLLTDKSRLHEIYDLRVEAYEHSPKSVYVNRQIFPDGWFDELDDCPDTLHWIVQDDNKIVAAARLAILDDLKDIKDVHEELNQYPIPKDRPFAYYSRLVIHYKYRNSGLSKMLDQVRVDYLREHTNIKFALGWATPDRNEGLTGLGFQQLGNFNYTWGGRQQSQAQSGYLFIA